MSVRADRGKRGLLRTAPLKACKRPVKQSSPAEPEDLPHEPAGDFDGAAGRTGTAPPASAATDCNTAATAGDVGGQTQKARVPCEFLDKEERRLHDYWRRWEPGKPHPFWTDPCEIIVPYEALTSGEWKITLPFNGFWAAMIFNWAVAFYVWYYDDWWYGGLAYAAQVTMFPYLDFEPTDAERVQAWDAWFKEHPEEKPHDWDEDKNKKTTGRKNTDQEDVDVEGAAVDEDVDVDENEFEIVGDHEDDPVAVPSGADSEVLDTKGGAGGPPEPENKVDEEEEDDVDLDLGIDDIDDEDDGGKVHLAGEGVVAQRTNRADAGGAKPSNKGAVGIEEVGAAKNSATFEYLQNDLD